MAAAPDAVAFLRGINVGGHTARKDQLIAAGVAAGLHDVGTFLASGNVVFRAPAPGLRAAADRAAVEDDVARALAAELGFDVAVFVRSSREVATIARRAPFPDVDTTSGTTQVGFLHRPLGAAARAAVVALSSDVDHLAVVGRELYWHTTGGTMDSPLGRGPALSRALGRDTTMRNVNTVRRLVEQLSGA